MSHTILVVDDEARLLDLLSSLLENLGYRVLAATSGPAALQVLEREEIDLVLTDLRMPGMSGRDLLLAVHKLNAATPVVIMTAYSSVRDAVSLMREGAFHYINKPIEQDELAQTLANALKLNDVMRDNERLREELDGRQSSSALIGQSIAFRKVLQAIDEVAGQRTTVLLTGESGTGKEVAARAIHSGSPRRNKPFVAVNCAAIPDNLLESEFFGHVKGAFTGALASRSGRFAQAEGGTLFLDEVGDMPLSLQAKILRVLQERSYEPVGSNTARPADVRVIAATNRDLQARVAEGAFREDLYYRLAVFPIHLPPLRDRAEDIPLLLDAFVGQLAPALGKRGMRVSAEARRQFSAYGWPGNIRELQNCVERSLISARGTVIEAADLPDYLDHPPEPARTPGFPIDLDAELAEYERTRIMEALQQAGGVQVRAAELLGINERSLWHRLKKFGITVSRVVGAVG